MVLGVATYNVKYYIYNIFKLNWLNSKEKQGTQTSESTLFLFVHFESVQV